MSIKIAQQIMSFWNYKARKNDIDGDSNTYKKETHKLINNLLKENNTTPEEYILGNGYWKSIGGMSCPNGYEYNTFSNGNHLCTLEEHNKTKAINYYHELNFPYEKSKVGLTKTAKSILDQKFPSENYVKNYNRIFKK